MELEFSFRGMQVSRDSFKPKKRRRYEQLAEPPAQLTLFDLWDQLKDQRMTVVRARRVDGAVEMTLRIEVPA